MQNENWENIKSSGRTKRIIIRALEEEFLENKEDYTDLKFIILENIKNVLK